MDDENEDLTSIELIGGHHYEVDGMEIDDGNQPLSTDTASGAALANNAQTDTTHTDTGYFEEHAQPAFEQGALNINGHFEQLAPGDPDGDESPSDSDGEEDDDSSDSDSDDNDSDDEDEGEENEGHAHLNQPLPNDAASGNANAHDEGLPGNAAEGFVQDDNEGEGTSDEDGESLSNVNDSENEDGMDWCVPCAKDIRPHYIRVRLKSFRRKRDLIRRRGKIRALKLEIRRLRDKVNELETARAPRGGRNEIRRTNIVCISTHACN